MFLPQIVTRSPLPKVLPMSQKWKIETLQIHTRPKVHIHLLKQIVLNISFQQLDIFKHTLKHIYSHTHNYTLNQMHTQGHTQIPIYPWAYTHTFTYPHKFTHITNLGTLFLHLHMNLQFGLRSPKLKRCYHNYHPTQPFINKPSPLFRILMVPLNFT